MEGLKKWPPIGPNASRPVRELNQERISWRLEAGKKNAEIVMNSKDLNNAAVFMRYHVISVFDHIIGIEATYVETVLNKVKSDYPKCYEYFEDVFTEIERQYDEQLVSIDDGYIKFDTDKIYATFPEMVVSKLQ